MSASIKSEIMLVYNIITIFTIINNNSLIVFKFKPTTDF